MTSQVQPPVSVIAPVYNTERYLAECIESVLAQTYENWEYVIVNNCSKSVIHAVTEMCFDILQTYGSGLRLGYPPSAASLIKALFLELLLHFGNTTGRVRRAVARKKKQKT